MDDSIAGTVIVCAGPPNCLFKDDKAVKNANEGCPLCERIEVHKDGTQIKYHLKTQ